MINDNQMMTNCSCHVSIIYSIYISIYKWSFNGNITISCVAAGRAKRPELEGGAGVFHLTGLREGPKGKKNIITNRNIINQNIIMSQSMSITVSFYFFSDNQPYNKHTHTHRHTRAIYMYIHTYIDIHIYIYTHHQKHP